MNPLRRETTITERQTSPAPPKIRWDWPAKTVPLYNWRAHRCWPRDGYWFSEAPKRR